MRSRTLFLLVFLIAYPATESAAQQVAEAANTVRLVHWPTAFYTDSLDTDADTLYPYDLLPFIDTLTLDYTSFVEHDAPGLAFTLAWTPGPFGVFDDRKVPYEKLPGSTRIIAIDLLAEVVVEEQTVATLWIGLDSLQLGPVPEAYMVDLMDLAWDNVFVDTLEPEARAYFEAGFTLRNLLIEQVAFASYETETYEPRYPERVTSYPPDPGIWIDWVIWPDRGGGGRDRSQGARHEPRKGIGRTAGVPAGRTRTRTGRTGRTQTGDRDGADTKRASRQPKKRSSGVGKNADDDDDDDDASLLPAALAGAVAVGVLAIAGGTIGYYGNVQETPIGLTSGYVARHGGLLLQVAINEAVIASGDERGKLTAKVMGFYDVFKAPIQPAFGVGVLAEERGHEIDLSPSFSVGAAANLGTVVLYGGYDLTVGSVEIGMALNFRHLLRSRGR